MSDKSRIETLERIDFNADTLLEFGSTFEPNSALICHTCDLKAEDIMNVKATILACELVPESAEFKEINVYFWYLNGGYRLSLATQVVPKMVVCDDIVMPIKQKYFGIAASISDTPYGDGDICDLFITKKYFDGKNRSEILPSGKLSNSQDSALLSQMIDILKKCGKRKHIPNFTM